MELVFEIGCEEIPASFQRPAVEWMAAELGRGLDEARLQEEGRRANVLGYATPRRLALVVTGLSARAPDVQKKLSGPPAKSAFGPDGKATKAGEGFAKKAGVDVSALQVEGDRVVALQELKGQTAAEALPKLLERIVRGIPFRKSMRWDSLEGDAWARPVHWITALLDGQPLPVRFADVESGTDTRGHRFHAPAKFAMPAAAGYVAALREAHVLADWSERRARVVLEVARAAQEAGGFPRADDELLETVTGLVEEPFAVAGYFAKDYLQLPPEVLVSEMRGHLKYFAVEDASGKLLPAFVAVSNTRVKDPAVSQKGYERAMGPRLADGKFFFDEDRKTPFRSRMQKLGRRTFMAGLGTEEERSARLRDLSLWLHGATGKAEAAELSEAAELCKLDLTSSMVGEFPELQGIIGRVYALHEGASAPVADAILEHYLPRGAADELPKGDAGALLGIADRLDQLVGIFGIGKEPSGTADPYGLRRSALGLLRVTLAKALRFDLLEAMQYAQKLHAGNAKVSQDPALLQKVWAFLLGRLEVQLKDRGQPDSIQAALHTGARDVVALERRLLALTKVRETNRAQFEATAAAFKRIGNILAQAQQKGLPKVAFDRARIPAASRSEAALADALEKAQQDVQTSLFDDEDFLGAYGVLAQLRPAVDKFFDDVMVMDPDVALRDNRLALLRALHELFAPLADFSRLQVESAKSSP